MPEPPTVCAGVEGVVAVILLRVVGYAVDCVLCVTNTIGVTAGDGTVVAAGIGSCEGSSVKDHEGQK